MLWTQMCDFLINKMQSETLLDVNLWRNVEGTNYSMPIINYPTLFKHHFTHFSFSIHSGPSGITFIKLHSFISCSFLMFQREPKFVSKSSSKRIWKGFVKLFSRKERVSISSIQFVLILHRFRYIPKKSSKSSIQISIKTTFFLISIGSPYAFWRLY